jgi:hypothetical protein
MKLRVARSTVAGLRALRIAAADADAGAAHGALAAARCDRLGLPRPRDRPPGFFPGFCDAWADAAAFGFRFDGDDAAAGFFGFDPAADNPGFFGLLAPPSASGNSTFDPPKNPPLGGGIFGKSSSSGRGDISAYLRPSLPASQPFFAKNSIFLIVKSSSCGFAFSIHRYSFSPSAANRGASHFVNVCEISSM